MFTAKRAMAQQAQNGDLKIVSFTDFAKQAKAAGFGKMSINLTPKNNGTPNISFSDGTNNVLINLSKGVSDALKNGKMKPQHLIGLQVVDGKNQKGEERYYLANNGREEFDVDAVILASVEATKVVAAQRNITDISKLVSA